MSIVVLLLLLLLSLPAWAATRYAHPSGGGGSCTDPGSPCSLNNALAAGTGGDTIILQSGTYNLCCEPNQDFPGMHILPNLAGSPGAETMIRVEDGADVTLIGGIQFDWVNGAGASYLTVTGRHGRWYVDGNQSGGVGIIEEAHHVTLEDLEIAWLGLGINGNFQNVTLRRLNVHHTGLDKNDPSRKSWNCACNLGGSCNPNINHPIEGHCHAVYTQFGETTSPSNFTIEGGQYHHNEGWGLHLYGSTGIVIRNVYAHHNCGAGIGLNYTSGTEIYNSLLIDNDNIPGCNSTYPGFFAGGGGGHTLYNNTIVGNIGGGINIRSDSSAAAIRNNIIIDNPGGSIIIDEGGSGGTVSNNLCNNAGGGCALAGTAANTFVNAPGNDYHLKPGSPAINTGINLIGLISDLEGNVRPEPGGSALDIGAYECQALIGSGGDCANAVPPPNLGLVVEHKTNGTDTSGNAFPTATLTGGTLTNGSPLTSNNTTSLVFDGVNDAMIEANDAAFRSAEFCWSVWINSSTLPAAGEFARFMSLGTAVVFGWGDDGKFVGYINNGAVQVADIVSAVNGQTHLLGLSFGGGFLRGWKDNANFLSVPFAGAISYVGNEQMTYGGVPTKYGAARANNFRVFDRACDPQDMQTIYDERVSQIGTTSTHWLFSQPDSAEITLIAGQGVDAPNITLNRSAEVLQSWNIKRNGSTTALHYSLECSLNSLVTFVTLTTSCASNPACIANDSVKNSGDATADVDGLPNDGFTFVPGRYEVDSVGAFTTTLLDGQVTKWRYGLAFNQSLADQDIVRCRIAGMDSYPATLPTITISVPIPSTGSDLKGGTFIGVTVK